MRLERTFRLYLAVTSHFHRCSWGNIRLIYSPAAGRDPRRQLPLVAEASPLPQAASFEKFLNTPI